MVEQLGFAEIVLFVCNYPSVISGTSPFQRLRRKLAGGLLLWRAYERTIIEKRSAATQPGPISPSLASVPKLEVEPIGIGKFRQAFDTASIDAVREYDLDVLLRFGFGILTGEILNVPRFGIWSFHHGDPKYFRGAPPGFWEIHNGDAATGVILQRLTETLDGGVVLHAGWFKTYAASYVKSLDRILFGAAHFVARSMKELNLNPQEFMDREPLQNSGPVYRYPRTRAMLRFFRRTTAAKFMNQYKALFRHQQWTVGVLEQPTVSIFESLSGISKNIKGVEWLRELPGRFLADPFPVEISGETMIMAEEFDWKTRLGRISIVPFKTTEAAQAVIQSEHHLSYPYTFDYAGETYCAPECAESNGVLLYRLQKKEGRWVEHKQIIKDFPAIDPTIFYHDARWWLFCTSAETGANDFLYAWFADNPTVNWTPHMLNPLKVDIHSSRPAGRPFMSGETLIRPAQDCSKVYGGAITFNRVLKLTPDEFLEEAAGQLLPDMHRYAAGLHTISGCGEQTVVDGARQIFVPKEFWSSARKKFRLLRQ